jgi:oligoribonuclease
MVEDMKKHLTNPMVWVDCEMTGLDLSRNHIIEIAVIVTDGLDLDNRIMGPEIVVQCPEEELAAMDEWCTRTHTESGLVDKIRATQHTLASAEQQILTFLRDTCDLEEFTCPLAGNSVGEDKRFLQKDMPELHNFFHYRVVDVSVLKELCRRWVPTLPVFPKKCSHRALDDIVESIEELKYYQKEVFGINKDLPQ